ncbi:MAG: non-homologous end-joining DNA ligase [Acidobacteriota bacterium]|nr:non-homologous end-joining DNA ligase [Acidobacteriota bacterium]MDQ5870876.1 non-homologous end-joining DNA ligase [Acidobacteriota bacterium]
MPFRVRPMLATLVDEPFHRKGWVYEEKYDGYRILAYKEGKEVTLYSRNAKDRTETFSEVARAIAGLADRALLLDGEAVAFDRKLVSRFQLLQQGESTVYAVFDCLYRNGRDLRNEPLPVRRVELEAAIGDVERLFPSRRLDADGLKAYRTAKRRGYEGLVAKDASAPYVEGRSAKWLKVKVHQEEEFVIGGYTAPAGSRTHFGALLLGAYRGPDLHYVGKVGTGFPQKILSSLHRRFQPLVRKGAAFVAPPREKGATWLAPKLVAQIAFQEWTDDQKLRQPVFLGLRDDKKPSEVLLPGATR